MAHQRPYLGPGAPQGPEGPRAGGPPGPGDPQARRTQGPEDPKGRGKMGFTLLYTQTIVGLNKAAVAKGLGPVPGVVAIGIPVQKLVRTRLHRKFGKRFRRIVF